MIAITSKCWLVEMLKCENVTNDYKWLRILKKFLRSYVYEWRGTPMLCPKSPHRLRLRCQYLLAVTVNICRLSLSISVGCRCQNLTLSPLSIFATAIIKQSRQLMQSWQSMQSWRSSYCSCCYCCSCCCRFRYH